jgi:hypothetical protein
MPEYTWWGEVPDHLRTMTQLADLDLPRKPNGPVRASITTRYPTGRTNTYDLFDLADSVPTTTSATRLDAGGGPARCERCGAHPDTPPTLYTRGGQDRHLCPTCHRIEQIRDRQHESTERRLAAVTWAAEILADPAVALISFTHHTPPAVSSGRRRDPVAVTLDACDTRGAVLLRPVTVALAGPRSKQLPAKAIALANVLPTLADALVERRLVPWHSTQAVALANAVRAYPDRQDPHVNQVGGQLADLAKRPAGLAGRVTDWRGQLDLDLTLRPAIDPVRADRYALLLRRMAHTDDPGAEH